MMIEFPLFVVQVSGSSEFEWFLECTESLANPWLFKFIPVYFWYVCPIGMLTLRTSTKGSDVIMHWPFSIMGMTTCSTSFPSIFIISTGILKAEERLRYHNKKSNKYK